MFSVLLFFATFFLAYALRFFRSSRFFPSKVSLVFFGEAEICRPLILAFQVRNIISDFSVFLSILIMTLISIIAGLQVKTLDVPKKFEVGTYLSWRFDKIVTLVLLSAIEDWPLLDRIAFGVHTAMGSIRLRRTSFTLDRPGCYGPTDHRRHCEPKRQQTEGKIPL